METTKRPSASAIIVFESMFGSTRQIAEAIATGLRTRTPSDVVSVSDWPAVDGYRLLVVGAPTHAHSLSRPASRAEAAAWAHDGRRFVLEDGSSDLGVREWLESLPKASGEFVAFDTRADMPRIFTGSAASAISKRLKRHERRELAPCASFLVDKDSKLLPGELDRARRWGIELGSLLGR